MIQIEDNIVWDESKKKLSEQSEQAQQWVRERFVIQNYTYDGIGRIVNENFEDSQFKIITTYHYYADSFLLSVNEPDINLIKK